MRLAPRRPGGRAAPVRRAATAALLLSAAACGSSTSPPVETLRPLTAVEQQVVGTSNGFAFDLLRRLVREAPTDNLVLSPLSGVLALGMAANGASGATRDEILRVIGAGAASVEEFDAMQGELSRMLLGLDRAVTVRVANAVFAAEGFPVRPELTTALRTHFGAEARNLDFRTREATIVVNDWAREATEGRIDPMFDDGELPPDLVVLLMNALYFKGEWTHRFDRTRTTPLPFTVAAGRTVSAPTMRRDETTLRVGGDADVEIGELPYGNGAYVMTIAMSRRGTVDDLLATLDWSRWQALLAGMREERMEVQLPKFTVESGHQWRDALSAMGMPTPFDEGRADFTALSAQCGCFIGFVKQKAVVTVDEEGTVAAAVTGTGIRVVSLPPAFRVDRPFLFAIRERTTGAILFAGVVRDPTK